jgi:hypothetical protein
MPIRLQFVASVNPLIYEVDALRGLMLVSGGGEHINPIGLDFAVIAVIAATPHSRWRCSPIRAASNRTAGSSQPSRIVGAN